MDIWFPFEVQGSFNSTVEYIHNRHSVLLASEGRSKNKADILPLSSFAHFTNCSVELCKRSYTTDLRRAVHPTRAHLMWCPPLTPNGSKIHNKLRFAQSVYSYMDRFGYLLAVRGVQIGYVSNENGLQSSS